jgi:hypothetical protein
MIHRMVVLVMVGIASGASPGRGAEVVHLEGWEGPATLVRHSGPGVEYFELVARAQWKRGASGRFKVRVALPGGAVETQEPRASEGPGARQLSAYVRATAVRDLRPAEVVVRVVLIDEATGASASNVLTATIHDFPYPRSEGSTADPGPFGWGRPLDGPPGQAGPLPRPGPDGFSFVRVPSAEGQPGVFVATTEATNAQVSRRLPGYDPRAGRSDDFILEAPGQPALNLSPKRAQEYLAGLGKADDAGVSYRLPSRDEWLRAARAGRSSAFWWGDEASYPAGANFLGPEPALMEDTTAPAHPGSEGVPFEANPWGLFHTFGNVAEWASGPSGGFVRLGGNFRTEPASPLPEVSVEGEDAVGPEGTDAYVGVRPAFGLSPEEGAEVVRRALAADPRFKEVTIAFDPDRATVRLGGTSTDPSARRAADDLIAKLWFVAAVENSITTPSFAPGALAELGAVAGPPRRITPLGRWIYEVPMAVRWADPLPVEGSTWYVNVYLPGGGHFAHRLVEPDPGVAKAVTVAVERARLLGAGLPVDAAVTVALSLGDAAPSPSDRRVASNLAPLRWKLPADDPGAPPPAAPGRPRTR